MNNQLDIKKPDTQFQILDVEEQLSCPVCTNTYYNPITLLCQHTFCHHCINDDKIKECPVCRVKKFIPSSVTQGITNNVLSKISELYYGIDGMNVIKEEVDDYLEDKEIRPKIEKEMETKLLSTLNDLAAKKSIPKKNVGIITSTTVSLHTSHNSQPIIYPYNIINNSPYSKYFSALKWLALFALSILTGWAIGTAFVRLLDNKFNMMVFIQDIFRVISIGNILYQYLIAVF